MTNQQGISLRRMKGFVVTISGNYCGNYYYVVNRKVYAVLLELEGGGQELDGVSFNI